MLRTGYIILICCVAQLSLKAQESYDFKLVDKESYRLYTEQKWDSLISLFKNSYNRETDYYYLRMRVGLARFHMENYRLAARHFKQALSFNEADPVALEYLYYSLLNSGQRDQALGVSRDFPASLKEKIPGDFPKPVEQISVEYLYSSSRTEEFSADPFLYYQDYPAGYALATSYYSNTSVTLTHELARGFSLFHSFTRLNKGNFFYYKDGFYDLSLDGLSVRQNQYYLSLNYATRSGFILSPAFHYLDISYQAVSSITGTPAEPVVTLSEEGTGDWVAGMGLRQSSGLFDYYLGSM